MSTELIAVEGSAEVRHKLTAINNFWSEQIAGKVFSRGAVGPNGQRYEHYVQNSLMQAGIHQGRWQTAQSVADDEQSLAVELLGEAATAVFENNSPAAARRYVQHLLDKLLARMQAYPPPPANSRYQRTGTLHDSWDTEMRL